MQALLRWYYTLRPLKWQQWWYRLARPVAMRLSRKRIADAETIAVAMSRPQVPLESLNVNHSYTPAQQTFYFLNRCHSFADGINWDFEEEGALWAYNLNYFEWLYNDSLSVEDRLASLKEFVHNAQPQKISREGYPLSLRIVAMIRFLIRFGIHDESITHRLYSDADWLSRFPEYHIQGNHLWENACAILCAGAYFSNEKLYAKGKLLLSLCIAEQVLADGGHIEGSPMYHSLLLWRLMQCLELLRALSLKIDNLAPLLADTSTKMLSWLQAMTFSDDSWPAFNDCSAGIAPATSELLRYAGKLGISPAKIRLHQSGYRMLRFGEFELAIDAAPVQPPYQPGHVHADIGNFCLHYRGGPVIVDTGTSTYELPQRRAYERSTSAHNTLAIGGINSSEIWNSFRTGRRSTLIDVEENSNSVSITYRPYRHPKTTHKRAFRWNDNCLAIIDELEGNIVAGTLASLHFQPGIQLEQTEKNVLRTGSLEISIGGADAIDTGIRDVALGFNRLAGGDCASFTMKTYLTTIFKHI